MGRSSHSDSTTEANQQWANELRRRERAERSAAKRARSIAREEQPVTANAAEEES